MRIRRSEEAGRALVEEFRSSGLYNGPQFLDREVEQAQAKTTQGEQNQPEKKKRARSPESGGRDPLPTHLPRVRVEVDLEEAAKVCPYDGARLVRIGERMVEKLEIVPAQFKVIEYVYPKYACEECEGHVAQAKALPQALPQAACEPGLLSYIIEQKFVMGLPLYRLEAQFKQLGVEVSRTSMSRWVIGAADLVGDLVCIPAKAGSRSGLNAG